MTTDFDSFDESPLGAFVESRLNARNDPRAAHALIVTVETYRPLAFSSLVPVLIANGIGTDVDLAPGANIHDYILIFLPLPLQQPSWLETVLPEDWTGVIHYCTENSAWTPRGVKDCIDSLEPVSGMRRAGLSLDQVSVQRSPVESHALTAGLSRLWHANVDGVVGGTVLTRTNDFSPSGTPWLSTTLQARIQWVMSGDVNHLSDDVGLPETRGRFVTGNLRFVQNLISVARATRDP